MADNTEKPKTIPLHQITELQTKVGLLTDLVTVHNMIVSISAEDTMGKVRVDLRDAAKALSADIKEAMENPRTSATTPVSADVVIAAATPRRSGQR